MKLSGLFARRIAAKSLAARSPVDIALFGAGVSAATASVVFAVTMFARGDHPPFVNGMQYLEIFAQPAGRPAVVASAAGAAASAPAPTRGDSRQSVDMSPTGSIAHGPGDLPAADDPYRLVAVEAGIAWLRNSVETRVIKPGDFAPGLGRVAAIVMRNGRWTLVDDTGATLLAADQANSTGKALNPFSRRMIFGGE